MGSTLGRHAAARLSAVKPLRRRDPGGRPPRHGPGCVVVDLAQCAVPSLSYDVPAIVPGASVTAAFSGCMQGRSDEPR